MKIMQFIFGLRRLSSFCKSFFETVEYPNCAPTANIPRSVKVLDPTNLYCEEKVSIGADSIIMNPNAKFIMKKWSFTARELLVIDGNHMPVIGMPLIEVTDKIKKEIDVNHEYNKDVIVDEDVWIGARVTLCSGVHIGRGAIIAAGAVVTRCVPPYSVWGGVPARHIRFKWTLNQVIEHEAKVYLEKERLPIDFLKRVFEL